MCLVLPRAARAQTEAIGVHDLSPRGSSPTKGTLGGSCLYCHAPHGGLNGTVGTPTPLWNQKLSSVKTYSVYTSGTMQNTANPSPPLGTDSTLCLSCHDGTVGASVGRSPGNLVAYGRVPMSGTMNSTDIFGTNLANMHPISFNLPLKPNSADLVPQLTAKPPSTADTTGAVKLINGNVECTSCHNPHVQNIDKQNANFLAIDNSSGALCGACHSTLPPGSGTGMGLVNSKVATQGALLTGSPLGVANSTIKLNPLAGWSTSIHATASNRVPSQVTLDASTTASKLAPARTTTTTLGNYGNVARNGCTSCHAQHNAQGVNSLLRAADDQACLVCHNGSSNTSPPTPNMLAEMVAPKYGHAFSAGNSPHLPREAAVENQNRHVTCADCHNPHATIKVGSFPAAPAIRLSQAQIVGVSATDGTTVLNPASNQYENCLRCHGTSTGKLAKTVYGYLPVRAAAASDPLNVIPQFSTLATSSHPVFRDRLSPYPQPSLRANMLKLDGMSMARSMGTRILCTDCHNSDDNREFGGSGPSGPHGSIFAHILERRYEFSQAGAPGTAVTNLFPNPSLGTQGGPGGSPYALCAKCHDLNQIMNNTSFSEHARHLKDGFSCSVCHTAHGMGAQTGVISGERLVNFDIKVVAPNGATPISYSRATNSCNLLCHNYAHQSASTALGKAARVR
jgi:predicted CXXCH cytochrome family protein